LAFLEFEKFSAMHAGRARSQVERHISAIEPVEKGGFSCPKIGCRLPVKMGAWSEAHSPDSQYNRDFDQRAPNGQLETEYASK
jgi:hypothetical protein